MRIAAFAATAALAMTACAEAPEPEATPDGTGTEKPMPVEPDGGIGDGAGPPDAPSMPEHADDIEEPSAFARTFPTAIRGKWRETGGAPVTAEQCDNYKSENMGKVLHIRADSYSYFETGGRFMTVSDRSEGHIRGVFDTTYADTPSRAELAFRVDPVAKTLTVQNFDAGEQGRTLYRRCPPG
ncbi:hypothetical protein [Alteriqipengyuania sp.]|uniref:hypothetical protein n=1 Tax=Alteriqipengyuania sp. TaxID=2800692 RepID=UPI003513C107